MIIVREGRSRSAHGLRSLLPLAVLAALACSGGSDARWTGTITDSAGIALVHNPDAGLWRESDVAAIARELDIGIAEGDAAYQFGQIVGLDVGSDHSIYVFDQQNLTVRVFDADGKFLRQMGRPGSGPGELGRGSTGLLLNAGDTVFVPDIGQQRMVRFTPDGQDAGSFPIPLQEGISIRWARTPDGMLVQQTRAFQQAQTGESRSDYLLLRDGAGTLIDTILALPAGRSFEFAAGGLPRMRIFEAEPIWSITTDGKVLYGMNSQYAIHVYDRAGRLERIIRRPFQQGAVTEADRKTLLDFIGEAMAAQGAPPQLVQRFLANIEFADVYPAFASIMGGIDGSVWVQRIQTAAQVAARGGQFTAQDVGGPTWDVFDGQGRYLGALELPDRFAPSQIKGDLVYGIWRDEMDVQHVVRLRITGTWTA
ncbi:MAG: 6-bladed beta-propeller [Longimicrobiales bacterium]